MPYSLDQTLPQGLNHPWARIMIGVHSPAAPTEGATLARALSLGVHRGLVRALQVNTCAEVRFVVDSADWVGDAAARARLAEQQRGGNESTTVVDYGKRITMCASLGLLCRPRQWQGRADREQPGTPDPGSEPILVPRKGEQPDKTHAAVTSARCAGFVAASGERASSQLRARVIWSRALKFSLPTVGTDP